MDGIKRRLNESIQFKLSFTLSLAILAIAVVAGLFSFIFAFDEAHELQDDVLLQIVQLIDKQRLSPMDPANDPHLKVIDEETRVIVQRLSEGNPSTLGVDQGGVLALPSTLADGLHTLDLGGETFRVLVKTTSAGERIAAAQESDFRDEIAFDSALRTVMPFLILVPILLLVVADLVRKMFRPIAQLSAEIDQRTRQELHPIEDTRLPIEIRPFSVAINRLLARVAQSIEAQRRFVADAAHELRSPLTALSLQAERLAEAQMSDVAQERLLILRQGIGRGRNLLEQLLSLAKVQSVDASQTSPVSVQGIYRRVLEDLIPLAQAKQIDIGVEGEQDYQVLVSESDLLAVVKNLVDNAIRYTPEGGRIDLSVGVTERGTLLRVQDNGPGIPVSERERVFAPFYRIVGSEQMGSGLGLSIVKTITDRIGATIHFEFSDPTRQCGLSATVLIRMNGHGDG